MEEVVRLIDGDALYKQTDELEKRALKHLNEGQLDKGERLRLMGILSERSAFKYDIRRAEEIDAVPVVRCKDCKHNLHHGKPNTVCGLDIPIFDCNGFCSEGEWGDDPSHPFADDVMMGERKDDV